MDPRDRADALLARARARRAYIVTPEDATSPMDAMNTLQIPRAVVHAAETHDEPEVTVSIPGPAARARAERTTEEETEPPTRPLRTLTEPTEHESPAPAEAIGTDVTDEDDRPQPRTVEGLIPTVQEPAGRKNSLIDRLRGND